EVVAAGHDALSRELDCLQTRAALAIDGRGRRGLWQAGVEPRVACDVQRLLTDLADAAANRIFDLLGIDSGSFEEALEGKAEHLDRMPGAELTATLAKRRAHRAEDDGLAPVACAVAAAHHRAPPTDRPHLLFR